MVMNETITRYTAIQRINHWLIALCFVLLTLSGLSMFDPGLFFLTNLFGGGEATRAIHPWIGSVLLVSFAILFIRFVAHNLPSRDDLAWLLKIDKVLTNQEEGIPEVGRNNAGQKFVFWSMTGLILVLFATGIVIWDQYFLAYTAIPSKRWAVLIHSLAAFVAIAVWIVHVYAALWIKGSMGAMLHGKVTPGWAFRHHRKWLRDLARNR
jgi:formate dehydrogenase subunit gamma